MIQKINTKTSSSKISNLDIETNSPLSDFNFKKINMILIAIMSFMLMIIGLGLNSHAGIGPHLATSYITSNNASTSSEELLDITLTNNMIVNYSESLAIVVTTPVGTNIDWIDSYDGITCSWENNKANCYNSKLKIDIGSKAKIRVKYWIPTHYEHQSDVRYCATYDMSYTDCIDINAPKINNDSDLIITTNKLKPQLNNQEGYIEYTVQNNKNHFSGNFGFYTFLPEQMAITYIDHDTRLSCNYEQNWVNCESLSELSLDTVDTVKIKVKYWISDYDGMQFINDALIYTSNSTEELSGNSVKSLIEVIR